MTDEDTNSVGWNGSTSCQRGTYDEVKLSMTLNYVLYVYVVLL